MNTRIRYTEEFKREAVSQVVERGHSVTSVASRLGVSTKSLYDWKKRYAGDGGDARQAKDADELQALRAELRRVTEERDILTAPARGPGGASGQQAAAYFAAQSR